MASKSVLVDDLDGSSGSTVSPVKFGLDGVDYTIDLSSKNAAKLRKLYATYIDAGRKKVGPGGVRKVSKTAKKA